MNYYQRPMCGMMPGFMPRPMPMMPQGSTPDVSMPATPYDSAPTTMTPPDFEIEPGAPVQKDISYTQGYLRSNMGKYVKIEFLIGTNMLIDREGIIVDVGISYVVLRESGTNDLLMCDIYSIKFVRIFDQQEKRKMLSEVD